MPSNPLAGHPPWRQLAVTVVALPVVVVAAVLAFAWPAGRIAPRDLPVGIVGTTPNSQRAVAELDRADAGAFDFRLYTDQAAARAAIRDREVYGAFVVTPTGSTVLEASAAGPMVAQLLTATGQRLAAHAGAGAARSSHVGTAPSTKSVDVVPISTKDPRGVILSSALLPLSICSILIAAAVAALIGFRPAWRQLVALAVVSAAAGAGAYLIAQGVLGALPHHHVATWGALALTVLAISAATAGLYALVGTAGLAASAAVMVFVGNPFSGATSAPPLLPGAVRDIGQWLPPGAGASLLRDVTYFGGNGAAGPLGVILLWVGVGLGAVAIGQHTSVRFAGHAAPPVRAGHATAERREPAAAGAHEAG